MGNSRTKLSVPFGDLLCIIESIVVERLDSIIEHLTLTDLLLEVHGTTDILVHVSVELELRVCRFRRNSIKLGT